MNTISSMLFVMLLGFPAMLLHECGHLLVALLCGVKVKKVGLCKTGLYTVREPGPNWANLSISLAGPLVNFVLAVVLRDSFPTFAWVNAIAFAYNLLPIPNSDGSRVLALLGSGRAVAVASKAGATSMGRSPAS
jgi:membrane-associated protease RseP (regulator of RpoE activity)